MLCHWRKHYDKLEKPLLRGSRGKSGWDLLSLGSEAFAACLGACWPAARVLQWRFQKQSNSLELGRSRVRSISGAPQNRGLCGNEQSCAKASDGKWPLAGGGCSCSSFERSWERCPRTTTGESVQMKGLVSVRVPSALFSGFSVISRHFGIWACWTSMSMD